MYRASICVRTIGQIEQSGAVWCNERNEPESHALVPFRFAPGLEDWASVN